MSAVAAIRAAEAAGVSIQLNGAELLLEAASAPSPVVIEALSHYKAAITNMLRGHSDEPGHVSHGALRRAGNRSLHLEWADGLATLALAPPAVGFNPRLWQQLVDDATRFMEEWADCAVEHGWTLLDVFGAHRVAPKARYDAMGLVPLLRGGAIVNMDSRCAVIRTASGSELICLKRRLTEAVSIWEICGSSAEGPRD